MSALVKPLSMNDCEIAIKMVNIPINPNSLGDRMRANTIPTKN
jgi:hypothetical protein